MTYLRIEGEAPFFLSNFFLLRVARERFSCPRLLSDLKELNPGFISVTCGAGGSTREKTNKWSVEIQNKHNLTTMSHYTSIGISQRMWKEI